jgi:ribosomal protein S18 acetylase RimI-like enzyme
LNHTVAVPTLRRASAADADELVRLRALMFAATADSPTGWEQACRDVLPRRLAEDGEFAAYVVGSPRPGGPLVCSGIGWVQWHLPAPHTPDGRRGHIGSVCTDESARRQGHARSVLHALLAWFDATGVLRVDLRAAPMAAALYRQLGFVPLGDPALSRLLPR